MSYPLNERQLKCYCTTELIKGQVLRARGVVVIILDVASLLDSVIESVDMLLDALPFGALCSGLYSKAHLPLMLVE